MSGRSRKDTILATVSFKPVFALERTLFGSIVSLGRESEFCHSKCENMFLLLPGLCTCECDNVTKSLTLMKTGFSWFERHSSVK